MSKKRTLDLKSKLNLNQIIINASKRYTGFFDNYECLSFTSQISLQEYQQEALKSAFIALDLFYNDNDFLISQYAQFDKNFKQEDSNRASFWMATGSGKTIVMIKLISLLHTWIQEGKIPKKPIMLLAPNDNILYQFKERIRDYNNHQVKELGVRELRQFESAGSLFDENLVYISRSDLLDIDENVGKDSKAKRLNFANFHNDGGWYILLDEAHRGETRNSVRKQYINKLARGSKEDKESKRDKLEELKKGGFIFNFSATFDDELDLQTCAFNYNLEKFNREGYGKNIAVLDSHLKAFKDAQNDTEKIERIVESFILFWAIKKSKENLFEEFKNLNLKESLLYHNPLIIAVSDKVNTQEAGIKLYFEAIIKVLKNELENFKEIAKNLYEKLKETRLYYGESYLSEDFLKLIEKVDLDELRKNVFHAKEHAHCEACKIKNNPKELVFKAKNSNKPFLLLNIGNTREWEKEYIQTLGIDMGEDLTQGYFNTINDEDSPINIMLGSKVFSEGWDSNRVNMICFINIGSKNAKKYVLQTVGRGVRIEPFKHTRKRLENAIHIYGIKDKIKAQNEGLESLFIMASDKEALKSILEQIEHFSMKNALKGFKKTGHFKPLYVPKYKESQLKDKSYQISKSDYERLLCAIDSYDEDVLLLSKDLKSEDFGLSTLCKVRNKQDLDIKDTTEQFKTKESLEILQILDNFFHSSCEEFDTFTELNDEICHFERFSSVLDSKIVDEINEKIKNLVSQSHKPIENKETLESKNVPKEYIDMILKAQQDEQKDTTKEGYVLDVSLKEHYYIPLIYKGGGADITCAINEKSEIDFLEDLKAYIQRSNNALKAYDWCFSKLVENVDKIYIPYFDKEAQGTRKFYPDFIFWLRHKDTKHYEILFIDPKGLEHESNPRYKAEGFESVFKTSCANFEKDKIKVRLFYYNKDRENLSKELEPYVRTSVEEIFKCMIEN